MFRCLRILIQIIAATVTVLVVLGLIALWRLNSTTMTASFLTPYISRALAAALPGTHVSINRTLVTWDNVDHAADLQADGIEVRDGQENVVAAVPSMHVRLNPFGFFIGRVWPTALTIENPQIKLVRRANGAMSFAGQGGTDAGPAADSKGDFRQRMADISQDLVHASAVRKVQIDNAVVSVHDEKDKQDWSLTIPSVLIKHQPFSDMTGQARLELQQGNKLSSLDLQYVYDRKLELHKITLAMSGLDPALLASTLGAALPMDATLPLSGQIAADLDENLTLSSGLAQLHGENGSVTDPGMWDAPRTIKTFDLKGNYDAKASPKLNISDLSVDFGGPSLKATVSGDKSVKAGQDMDFTINLKLAAWPMDQFGTLWPKTVVPDAREWMIANMTKGRYDRGEAVFKGSLNWNDLGNLSIDDGQGKISASHGQIKYLDGMPPVEDVSTEAEFDLKQLTANITGGGIGDIRLQPFTIQLTGFDKDTQRISIPIKLSGPVPSVMKLIDAPPLGYTKSLGLKPDDITGQVDGSVNLDFPLLKTLTMKDVAIKVDAQLSNIASTKLVKGIDISDGRFSCVLDPKGFQLKGPATLDKIPAAARIAAQVTWQQNFETIGNKPIAQGTVSGTVDEKQWAALGLAAIDGSKGASPVNLQITLPAKGNKTLITGSVDLGPVDLRVNQLNWHKPAGTQALLQFDTEIVGDKINAKKITLRGPRINAEGSGQFDTSGQVLGIKLDPMVLGRNNAAIIFSQSFGDNGKMSFEADGSTLDISGMLKGNDPARSDPRPKEFKQRIDRLYTGPSDIDVIDHAEGFAIRDGRGWSVISLHGLVGTGLDGKDAGHALDVSLAPQPNGSKALTITCDNFGAALRGLGMTDNVLDGNLDVRGASTPEAPYAIAGTIKVKGFSVANMPLLMVLLNATSPLNIGNLLSNKVAFDRLRGKFVWNDSLLDIKDWKATGGAVGINASGRIDMNAGQLDLKGTVVPFSLFNRVIGAIPLIGDLISGSDSGGLIAMAYAMTGPVDNPSVSVNPVSLITPGFLRNLFFGGDEDEEPAMDTPAPAPAALPKVNEPVEPTVPLYPRSDRGR